MDNWQQDWLKMLETAASSVEQFFQEIGQEISDTLEAVFGLSDELADEAEQALTQFEATIAPGLEQLDQQITEWLDPILVALLGLEDTIDRATAPMTRTVEPMLNQHPVCVGCQHYHGQMYGGNMLVCGMHPYGVEEGVDYCPDKELVSWSLPSLPPSHSDDQDF